MIKCDTCVKYNECCDNGVLIRDAIDCEYYVRDMEKVDTNKKTEMEERE